MKFNIIIYILSIFIIFVSCQNDDFASIIKNEANPFNSSPLPGNNGLIKVKNITDTSISISWVEAICNSQCYYQVVFSDNSTLLNYDEINTSGLTYTGWTPSLTQIIINNLLPKHDYVVNIVVKDENDNIAVYKPIMFSTLGRIYLFDAGTFTGNMLATTNSINYLNDICAEALKNYPQIDCDNVVAFISISIENSILNMKSNYSIPINLPIYSPDNILIAENWYDLLDGSIQETLLNAKVITNGNWWSGSKDDGSFDEINNCNGWTSDDNSVKGRTGSFNKKDNTWIYNRESNCNIKNHLIGLCW